MGEFGQGSAVALPGSMRVALLTVYDIEAPPEHLTDHETYLEDITS
ncbi:MAG TPA: hypothetical protein VFI00_11365 [Kribbella sp.]|nr:hypothetical protein [Kribbella sp.]